MGIRNMVSAGSTSSYPYVISSLTRTQPEKLKLRNEDINELMKRLPIISRTVAEQQWEDRRHF